MSKIKSSLTTILFIAMLLGAFIVPAIILSEKKEEKESFPEAQKIKINKRIVDDSTTNARTRKTLETDPYFIKFAMSPNYNYSGIRKEVDPETGLQYSYIEDGYLKNMIVNFVFNYQLSNTSHFTSISYNTGYFCMSALDVKIAMEELYYTTIGLNDFIEYIPGYIDFVTTSGSSICFNFDKVSKMNDNDVLLGIKSISISDQKNITADVYIYKFYSSDTSAEKSLKQTAKKYIDSNNYSGAEDVVVNKLGGSVEHRKIVFKINSRKKYFEYQLLYSGKLNN